MSAPIVESTSTHSPAVAPRGAAFADPGPLGLAAFALTTFLLSFANTGILPAAVFATLGPALFYGGAMQLLAGIWEFAKGNTFGATAFSSYGAFWMAFWYLVVSGDVDKAGNGVGLFLIAFGIFTLYMFIASLRTTGALIAVFGALTITFFLLGFGAFGASGLTTLGGYFGILTALLAWYASFAGVLNATWGRVVLPVFPRA